MEDNIHKIWGERRRILLTDQVELDYLVLIPNSFCSIHTHKDKINKFLLLEGEVSIRTEYGTTVLKNPGDHFSVEPPISHRFEVKTASRVVEIAYVNTGSIDVADICREKQGGRLIDIGKGELVEMTLYEMKDKGLLDLCGEGLIQ